MGGGGRSLVFCQWLVQRTVVRQWSLTGPCAGAGYGSTGPKAPGSTLLGDATGVGNAAGRMEEGIGEDRRKGTGPQQSCEVLCGLVWSWVLNPDWTSGAAHPRRSHPPGRLAGSQRTGVKASTSKEVPDAGKVA